MNAAVCCVMMNLKTCMLTLFARTTRANKHAHELLSEIDAIKALKSIASSKEKSASDLSEQSP